MLHATAVLSAVLVTLPFSAFAADDDVFEQILLPVYNIEPIPGAFGSVWETELWVRNNSDEDVRAMPCIPSCQGTGFGGSFPATSTTRNPIPGTVSGLGAMMHIWVEESPNMAFSLRLFERSENTVRQGIEIPVVRESEFLSGTGELLAVPVGSDTRSMMRVYDPYGIEGAGVLVEVFPMDSDELLASRLIDLDELGPRDPSVEFLRRAQYGSVPSLQQAFGHVALPDQVRLRLTGIPSNLIFWAFVSVTDNETQYVTLITPQ